MEFPTILNKCNYCGYESAHNESFVDISTTIQYCKPCNTILNSHIQFEDEFVAYGIPQEPIKQGK